MIRRANDFSIFSDNEFERLANKLSHKRELFDVYKKDEENKLKIAEKELRMQGFLTEIEELPNVYKLYYIITDKILKLEAEQSGEFKKLAWGRYVFQKSAEINEFNKYNFDDGTVWKTIVDEDGKEYLVKEIDDEDEDKIMR